MAITLDGTNGVTTPDLTVDTDTLTVDATNNRVGIGTTSPSCSLQVNGGIRARGGAPGAAGVSNNGYAFSGNGGDNDSGMYSSADGRLEFYTNNAECMRITSSGNITTPSQPSIYLEGNNSTDVSFTSGQQFLVSTYYTQTYTRGGMSWNSGTGRVTVPTTGHYLITFARYETGASGRVEIRKNGSNINLLQTDTTDTDTHSFVYEMSANDYIEIVADSFDLPQSFMGVRHTHFSLNLLG